ncbi:MAG TPA: hypothetical protein VGF87_09745 [Acidimicrobiales bacterium]|jgi:hypothetical protein
MRVVIDGLSLNEDRDEIAALESLLAAWPQTGGDELHVVVAEERALRVPSEVTVHRVRRGGRPLYRRLARAIALPRLCRSLRAHAVLDARPAIRVVPLPCPRLSLVGVTTGVGSGAVVAGVVPGSPTWAQSARRLHVAVVDRVATASWRMRRFALHPSFFVAAPDAVRSRTVVPFGEPRSFRTNGTPGRSVRWIVAASVSTLALSAAAAASMDLVTSHSPAVTTPQHLNSGTAPINVTQTPSILLPSGAPTISSTTPVTSAPATTAVTPTTTSTTAPATSSAPAVTTPTSPGLSVPSLPLPTLTLPTITIPSLPLPTISCSSTTTSTSSLSILHLCSVTAPSLPLGSG